MKEWAMKRNPDTTCVEKVRYSTYLDAKKAEKGMYVRKVSVGEVAPEVYYCDFCKGYHLGRNYAKKRVE
jgi:hypothetical protein